MEITNTVSYKLSFRVAYHGHGEGGMDSDTFGRVTKDMKSALQVWEIAKQVRPEEDWEIVCEVERYIK